MIEELKSIIKDERFKVLLNNPDIWESKDVDYTTPRVERVWMPINDKRLSLHVIHPCEEGEAYLHPHVWETAMYVLPIGGKYEHGISILKSKCFPTAEEKINGEPDLLCRQEFRGDVYYEMLNEHTTHYVRPIGLPVFTIMLSGKPIWKDNACTLPKKLVSLSDERKKEILLTFKQYFE